MKKIFLVMLIFVSSICFYSCANNSESKIPDYDISEIYGYITASSGNTLIPSLIIYSEDRCDWNMSMNNMNNNQFYYYAEKNSNANYTLYWYSPTNVSYCKSKDTSMASMIVQLGINSVDEIVILLTGDELTGVSGMTNTRVAMQKQTGIKRNTSPTEIKYDIEVSDISITIPDSATETSWNGENSYEGSFVYLVGDNGSMGKGKGSAGKDSDGNTITPKIEILDANSENSVTLKMNSFAYTDSMVIDSYTIPNVKVLSANGVLYLYREAASDIIYSKYKLNDLSVYGKLEDDVLTLRVSFKPGKMPFALIEIFTSN